MKPLTILLFLFNLAGQAGGQINASGTGYLNHIYYAYRLDSLAELEQSSARMVSKTKAMGFGGSEGDFQIAGEKSTKRIKAGDTIRFVFKSVTTMMDPTMMIRLYRFYPKKGGREAVVNGQGGAYNKGKTSTNENEISFNVLKEPDGFILIPANKLVAGEYGFLNMMMINNAGSGNISFTVFAFGVD